MLRTHFIVLKSTLSAQNCIKHIHKTTNYTWGFNVNTEEKLIYASLKLPSPLGTLLSEKQNKKAKQGGIREGKGVSCQSEWECPLRGTRQCLAAPLPQQLGHHTTEPSVSPLGISSKVITQLFSAMVLFNFRFCFLVLAFSLKSPIQ